MLESSVSAMQQKEFWKSSLADWKDDKRWFWPQWLPNFAPCMVPYFMWNTSAAQLQTPLSVEHKGVNLLAKQSLTHKTCLGTEVCTQALPLDPPWLWVSGCASGRSAWAGRLPLVAPWTAVQSTHGCFSCWLLTLEHRNHNLFWKCKRLHWPGPGCSAISCQAPSF